MNAPMSQAPTHAHGLIIGKFYPPHAGHHLLIRAAADTCDRVTVIAMAASHETLPLGARLAWLRAEHADTPHVAITGCMDDVRIDHHDPAIWAQHVALMRASLTDIDAPPVTAVFSSEPYGLELARHFDAQAVVLDADRLLAPISATAVREDPVTHWDQLSEPARAGLAMRVVVVGAESSGTTTLSQALADYWRNQGDAHGLTRWVPEYGRTYTMRKWAAARARAQLRGQSTPQLGSLTWDSDEFIHIAQRQVQMEEQAAALGGPLLICDTDAFATAIWHERYLGQTSLDVLNIAAHPMYAPRLYLLTDHADVPFEQDGIRDGESLRPWMTERFAQALASGGRIFLRLSGSHAERLQSAITSTRTLVKSGWNFAAPFR
jgi:NadR type nicotinamide-nucleotide adenylyltransferase